jgi:hypothetical protein
LAAADSLLGMSKPTSRPRAAIATSLALAGALLVALTGCAGAPASVPTGSSSPGAAAPLFASDAEALAAATAAYAKYLEVSDQIAREGGANPERLKPFVSEALFANELKTYAGVTRNGLRAEGKTTFDRVRVQSNSAISLQVYACARADQIRVLNTAGVDVTPPNRPAVVPVSLTWVREEAGKLTLESSDTWTGVNFCG